MSLLVVVCLMHLSFVPETWQQFDNKVLVYVRIYKHLRKCLRVCAYVVAHLIILIDVIFTVAQF